jgi:hypothetical protein
MASLPGTAWSQSAWPGYPNNTAISVTSGGNVGIGTTSPSGALAVSGNNSNGVLTYVNNDASTGFAGIRVIESGSAVNGLMLEYLNSGFSPIGVLGPNMGAIFSHSSASGGLVVGTNAPAPVRFFTGNLTAERMRIDGNGNVGIGTTSPSYALDVAGGVIKAGNALTMQSSLQQQNNWQRGNVSYGVYWNPSALNWSVTDQTYNQASLQIDGSGSLLYTSHSGALSSPQTDAQWHAFDRFYVRYDGNVGIGTTNPTSKLSVNGTIQAKEVVVNTGWADYVFSPKYRLRPLSEVAAYIQQNHHLPEIPSEAEVKEQGVSLGEMQSKLLAKVEELTLHMIQAEARNDRLEREVRELRSKVANGVAR